ncbi:hypothetical protein Tco_0268967 [Tanacetum coccineum]
MSRDQSIPRRNKVDWHMANDDTILTTMRFIPQHEVVQKYSAILPDYLTNQAMKESEAYKTYYAFAIGNAIPKPKYVRRSAKEKTEQAPKASSGKRIKSAAKVTRSGKKKQLAEGLETLSEIALSEAKQMKLAIERSKTQLHSSQASGSGAHKGTGVTPGVPDVPTYGSDDEQIYWKSSDEEDDDDEANISKDDDDVADEDNDDSDDNERTESDNDGNDFVHPKLTTHDEEDKEEDNFDPRVHTPSHVESTDDEDSDEEIQEVPVQEVCRDENVNLMGSDVEMIDAQVNQDTEDAHVTLMAEPPVVQQQSSSVSSGFISNMLNPNPDTGIDSVLNVESTSLVDVPVTSNVEIPPTSATILPPLPLPLILPQQQTPVPTTTTAPTLSSIPDIDNYLGSKLKDAVDVAVQLKSEKLRDEAQHWLAYEADKDILEAYGDTVALKRRRDDQDKDKEPSAGSNRGSKRRRTGKEPESTSAPKEKTSKSTGKSRDGSESHHMPTGNSTHVEVPTYTAKDLEEPAHQEFETGVTEDQHVDETSQLPDWFQKPEKLPSPNRDWNKTLPDVYGSSQPWLSNLARKEDPRKSFDELMDTPLDFSAFVMNRLNVDTLTPELLVGPTFGLIKGTCKSLVELEYFFEEVYKATTKKLDWNNPEGQQYPHDLRKPLPLIPNSRGPGPMQPPLRRPRLQIMGTSNGLKSWESARNIYFRRRIIAITKLQIVEWHGYKHLHWITVRRDDDKLYTFKEGDFKRLRLQDIEDMLILLTIWRKSDRERAAAMIQAIDKQLKSRRIIRSLERFVGGETYRNTTAGNLVKEILLKLNLPDHRILKDGGEGDDDTLLFTVRR